MGENSSKAPGPNGLSFLFYQQFWHILEKDLSQLISAFYNHQLDLSKLNHATVILIHKVVEANNIKQYRPISLINCSFKIITKILANRLATVMDFLIAQTQTAYIKGRIIFDNIVCVQEILHQVRKNKIKGILLKLDFEKAFDKAHWNFILEILQARGFGDKFIH